MLTGEHVYPWMFEELGGLAGLREAAHLLAEHDWPRRARARAPDALVVPLVLRDGLDARVAPGQVGDLLQVARLPCRRDADEPVRR